MTVTVGYLTKRFPRLSETFILDEIIGLEAAGVPLRLYAIAHPGERITQPDVSRLSSSVVYLRGPGGWRQSVRDQAAVVRAHGQLLRRSPRRYLAVVAYIARKRRHLSTLRHFAEAGRLAVLLQRDDARHVHAAFAHGPASVAHFVHLLTGIPFSFAGHAKDIYVSAPDLLARKVAAASFVLACSESAAQKLRALSGPAAGKVVLAPHGVDTVRFAPPGPGHCAPQPLPGLAGGRVRVLAVGRLVEKKGYPVLLEALAALATRSQLASCRIIGAGPDEDVLRARVARLGLAEMVELSGACTHQEIAEAYLAADVFVQASVVLANGDRDGIPNSLLEAMSSGLAVVASSVAGIPEVVVPGSGLLVPPGDPSALAGAVGLLADDPALRASLGRAARSRVVASLDRQACIGAVARLFEAEPAKLAPVDPVAASPRPVGHGRAE